jgi:hypothetical protein
MTHHSTVALPGNPDMSQYLCLLAKCVDIQSPSNIPTAYNYKRMDIFLSPARILCSTKNRLSPLQCLSTHHPALAMRLRN